MIIKKQYETTEQRIIEYESVVRFYEKNREGRFQTKEGLYKIAYEINLELEKDNSNRLHNLQNRINRLI